MGNKKAIERLERAEAIAREVWRQAGVERPNEGQLAAGILYVLEHDDGEVRDGEG
jgi:hypothetical protein